MADSVWRHLLDPAAGPLTPEAAARLRPAMARLAQLTSPATAASLLAPILPAGFAAIPEAEVVRDRLATRYLRAEAGRWLALLDSRGIAVVALKGFATGLVCYPSPEDRGLGDVDLLVPRADLGRLVATLAAEGFRFRKAAGTPRWGLASDASFHPFVAPAGPLAFDLHVQPDDFPVHRSLSAETIFAAARRVPLGRGGVLVPCDAHLFLLALTNAARDKYDPHAVKCLVDAAVRLTRVAGDVDWQAVRATARAGGYESIVRLGALALHRLGLPADRLARDLLAPYRGLRAVSFERAVADLADCFARPPSKWALQRREWLLTAPPAAVAFRNVRRLRGMLRPWRGVPNV